MGPKAQRVVCAYFYLQAKVRAPPYTKGEGIQMIFEKLLIPAPQCCLCLSASLVCQVACLGHSMCVWLSYWSLTASLPLPLPADCLTTCPLPYCMPPWVTACPTACLLVCCTTCLTTRPSAWANYLHVCLTSFCTTRLTTCTLHGLTSCLSASLHVSVTTCLTT